MHIIYLTCMEFNALDDGPGYSSCVHRFIISKDINETLNIIKLWCSQHISVSSPHK